MAVVENLFVYGAWCEGGALHSLLKNYIGEIRNGYILGQAYRSSVGYPVYVADGGDLVPGELVTVRGPDVLWRLLEDFHGLQPMNPNASLFQRMTRSVFDESGTELSQAHVFHVNPHMVELKWQKIPGGDWRRDISHHPPLPDRMTERQKGYIRRLGRSSGREIVPIDLDLYRELMKLELIVDKGRRLALSSLGRELLRFLHE
jgi:gamma-glutamylcyclotransferase (GGCT)/AIG2-like uncharacterized protein YtfP